jgi:hypothetical protein
VIPRETRTLLPHDSLLFFEVHGMLRLNERKAARKRFRAAFNWPDQVIVLSGQDVVCISRPRIVPVLDAKWSASIPKR